MRTRLSVLPLEDRLTPAAGDLDPTFGTGGRVVLPMTAAADGDEVNDVALLPDGRTVLAGFSTVGGSGVQNEFAVARLLPDGSPDPSFDGDGRLTMDFNFGGYLSDQATAVAALPDGRILVAGTVSSGRPGPEYWTDVLVLRLNPDGSPDPTFGTGGRVLLQPDARLGDRISAEELLVRPDGRLVLAGWAEANGDQMPYAAGLLPDGRLDPGFSGDGLVRFGGGAARGAGGYAAALSPDGGVVVAGVGQGFHDFLAWRLTPAGDPDPAFGTRGAATLSFGDPFPAYSAATARAVAVRPDGRVVMAGRAETAFNKFAFAVGQLTAAGVPDPTFGANGRVTLPLGPADTWGSEAKAVALLADGRLLVAGFAATAGGGPAAFAVARLRADGTPDPVFGTNGTVTVGTPNSGFYGDRANAVAVQADGRVVVAGSTDRGNLNDDFAVVRLLGEVPPQHVPLLIDVSVVVPVLAPADPYGPRPNASQNEAFVKGLYRTILGRDADAGGVQSWTAAMANGRTPLAVTGGFWNSPENRARQVDGYYQFFLGRGPDAAGRQSWMNVLLNRVLDEAGVAQQFLQSPEAIARGGSTGGYVDLVYLAVLNRPSDAAEPGRLGAAAGQRGHHPGSVRAGAGSVRRVVQPHPHQLLPGVPEAGAVGRRAGRLAERAGPRHRRPGGCGRRVRRQRRVLRQRRRGRRLKARPLAGRVGGRPIGYAESHRWRAEP